tara:strand:- start:149924 stop:150460 length:537 start_codon:yes stop_codon:yes gene_type:complete
MSFLVNTLGKWKVGKLFQQNRRIPEALNLERIESAILVCNITDSQSYKEVQDFATYLKRSEGLSSVKVICYFDQKEKPTFVNEESDLVFGKKDCNIFGLPNKVEYNFKKPVDLLVDFTSKSCVPTNYFICQINAKTVVGKQDDEKGDWFDLIIDIPKEKGLPVYKENILRYLKMINKA